MDANREQQEAIEHTDGPLLVTAGPGTGKTFVIENKVRHLATEQGVHPSAILCLTFTDKAATELRDRVGAALSAAGVEGEVQAATFHSFAQGLLSEFAGRAGLPPDFHLLNGAPLEYLLLGHLDRFPIERTQLLDGGISFAGELLWLRQRCLQERISPDEAQTLAEARHRSEADKDARAVWAELIDLSRGLAVADRVLGASGALTYEDLIAKALALVEDDAVVRATLARRYRHLLVDEFQDNNYAQSRLVHALASLGITVTVVGDEDQSIYKFRGAYERTLKEFLERFGKDARRVDLVANYRSTPVVLEAAETLIRHGVDRLEKPPLQAARDELPELASPVRVIEAEYPDDEARAVAAEIARIHWEEGVAYGDVAVLYRGGNVPSVKVLPQALDELGIPQEIATAGDLFERPEVKDLVSWLLVLRSPGTPGPALHRVLTSPEVALPLIDEPAVTHAVKYGRERRGLGALASEALEESLTYTGRRAVRRLLDLADELVEARRGASPSTYVGLVLRRTGLLARLTRMQGTGENRVDGLGAARSLVRLVQVARDWERAHPLSTVDDFADYLDFLVRRGSDVDDELDLEADDDAVQVMTVHKSKGKEFPVVFVLGLSEGQFPPGKKRPRLAEHLVAAHRGEPAPIGVDLEEERRLLFVAMTRAMDRLYLTRHHRTTATSRGIKKPSGFLGELGLPVEEPQAATLPVYLAYDRIEAEAGGLERPLSVDEGLWLTSRVAARVHALAGSDEPLTEGAREVVEAALRAVAHARPDADVAGLAKALAPVLGELDVPGPTRAEEVDETLASQREGRRFSYSAFRMYDTCPKQYYYRYLLGVPEPPARALERGTLVHRVLERWHREHGSKGTREELHALLDDEIARRFTAVHDKEAADTREELLGYLDAYWAGRDGFEGTVQDVETNVNVELPDFRLMAKLDRVDALSGGGVELVDYKTSRAQSANHHAGKDLQIPLYVLAWQKHAGELPRRATVWSLKDAKVVRLDVASDLGEERLAEAYEKARGIVEAIDEGRFEATPGFHCRMCSYNFICEDASR